MNKKIAFWALLLLGGATLAGSCGDDDPQPDPIIDPVVTPVDEELATEYVVTGWSSATHVPPEVGRRYFVDYYSAGETAEVTVKREVEKEVLELTYSSDAWGTATYEFGTDTLKVDSTALNGPTYVLPQGAETIIVMGRGAFGQQGGGEYRLTLVQGEVVVKTLAPVSLTVSAFMNENHGSYEITFHEGDAPSDVVE